MIRYRVLCLLLVLTLSACSTVEDVVEAPPLPPKTGPSYAELQDEALAAYRAKQYSRMEGLLKQAEVQRPNHPRALYNLAAARALQGDAAGALDYLEKLERMKLAYRVWEDADFASLKEQPRFAKLTENFQRHLRPQGIARFSFTAGVNDFMPEGLAYDRDTGAYFLGSVRQRRVLKLTRADERVPLINSGENGIFSVLGMKIEPTTRRLWVASAALPVMEGFEEEDRGRSGLWAFDKDSGQLRGRFLLPRDGREHALGDLIISSKGMIYSTDSAEGMLYALDRKTEKFTRLTVPGALESPQGLTFADGQRYIYLADYNRGLFRFDLEQNKLEPLQGRDDVCVYGIDGLYYYKGALVAIQNGIRPNRVARIELDETVNPPRIKGMQVLAANHPDFDEPTLGVLQRNGMFYFVANSHWNRVNANNRLPPQDELKRPIVMSIDLDKKIGPAQAAQ